MMYGMTMGVIFIFRVIIFSLRRGPLRIFPATALIATSVRALRGCPLLYLPSTEEILLYHLMTR